MIKRTLLAAACCSALGILTVSAQVTLETVQQFVVGPQPDGWSFNFQISRFLPSTPNDTLVKVELVLTETTTYPGVAVTATQDGSVANVDVSEVVTVKNLKFNADDGYDDDSDSASHIEVSTSTELAGSSSVLGNGATQTISGGTITTNPPTITLTDPDDLARFNGDTNSPKAINIKMVNKQSRTFTFKAGKGTFSPDRKVYDPTTSATLTLNYYTSTTSTCDTVQSAYTVNAAYLTKPSAGTYSSTTHQ